MAKEKRPSKKQKDKQAKGKRSRRVRFSFPERARERTPTIDRPHPRQTFQALGIRSITDLEKFGPYRQARLLIASGENGVPLPEISDIVSRKYADQPVNEAAGWPVEALRGLSPIHANALERSGIQTIADLSALGSYIDGVIARGKEFNGFSELPSAPAELLPTITGAISTSKRYSKFVKSMDVRGLKYGLDKTCTEYSPFPYRHAVLNQDVEDLVLDIDPDSQKLKTLIAKLHPYLPGNVPEERYSLGEIFTDQDCPVLYLGYLISQKQEWINLGTYLGEVKRSISLAPGESRQIAFLDWQRRQTLDRTEDSTTDEQLTSTIIHNRALEETTQAVAIEQQLGGTETEASTSTLALSAVGSAALAGGLAGGAGGALVGTFIEPGLGTAIGGGVGAVLGGAVGLAGGAVYTSSQLLGTIMATSEGDRKIAAELNQRITQSTQQNSGLVQSLYSTIVLDDIQAEQAQASTRNITNYNHMHTLNIMYYEVLQQYLTRTHVTRVEPLLYLPYSYMDFTGLKFIRDYWDVLREYVDDDLKMQGDAYFAEEGIPSAPDRIPEPPIPVPPDSPEPYRVEDLIIDIFYDAKGMMIGANMGIDLGLSIMKEGGKSYKGNQETMVDFNPASDEGRSGYVGYSFSMINNAHEVNKIVVSRKQETPTDLDFKIRIRTGKIKSGSTVLEDLSGVVIASNKKIKASQGNGDFYFSWIPVPGYETALANLSSEYERRKQERDDIIAENQKRQQVYDQLVENNDRFKARLETLILRRRHFFTRIILNAMEAEELKSLLDRLFIYTAEDEKLKIPLHAIAHTQPVAMTPGAFVLKMKRFTEDYAHRLQLILGVDSQAKDQALVNPNLKELLIHNHAIDELEAEFQDSQNDSLAHVYMPTGGLFAEALLGRANGAEYHNLERYTNWQDAPIPHQPPAIEPLSLASRSQQQSLSVTEPNSNLNLVNAPQFPDPTGMSGILAAIQNGNMFRDMSKSAELAGMLDNLMALSGQMGQAASQMTGEAAKETLQSAVQMGQLASKLAEKMFQQAMSEAGNAYKSRTDKGATIGSIKKNLPAGPEQEQAIRKTLDIPDDTPVTGTNGKGNGTVSDTPTSSNETETSEDPQEGGPFTTNLPDLPQPGQVGEIEPIPTEAGQTAVDRISELIQEGGATDKAKMVAIMQDWYDESVLPGLKQASNDDRFLLPATSEWLDWLTNTNRLGVSADHYMGDPNLDEAEAEAREWVIGGLRNAVLQASQRAIETNNLDYFGDAIYWSSLAEMWALASDANRLQIYDVIEDFPLKVVIFDAQPDIVALDETFTFSTKAGLQIGDNPILFKPALHWEIQVNGGSISGFNNGQTNLNGGFSTVITRTTENDFTINVKVVFMDGPQDFDDETVSFHPALPA